MPQQIIKIILMIISILEITTSLPVIGKLNPLEAQEVILKMKINYKF